MKVLIISIVPSPYQRDLFAALSREPNISLTVKYVEGASPDSPWPEEPLRSFESVYASFWMSWGGKRFIINRQLPDVNQYDIIVLNGYINIPAQFIMRFYGIRRPFIFWGEKMMSGHRGLRRVVHNFLTEPLKNAAGIVAIGKEAERNYRARYANTKVYELPYYCSLEAYAQEHPVRPRDPICLLFCGQMIKRKGVDLLLGAFADLVEAGYSVRLLLVGREAELPQMLQTVPEAVRSLISYVGFKSPEALPPYFKEADIFILPSRYDGWGVVVNQALGAGLPLICSDAVGSAESLISENENGYIFPNGDQFALKSAIRKLLENPEQLNRFASNSRRLSNEITPEVGAKKWVKILFEVKEKANANSVCK